VLLGPQPGDQRFNAPGVGERGELLRPRLALGDQRVVDGVERRHGVVGRLRIGRRYDGVMIRVNSQRRLILPVPVVRKVRIRHLVRAGDRLDGLGVHLF
jgi:hypothetical protein